MFRPTPNADFPKLEQQVLDFWRERAIYAKSLARREGSPKFVFYEGPPTANGMPHPGHCLTRAIKDLFPRYQTMRGRYCERKAGWDTHGLPVEVEVCKELGIHAKEEIEAYGIEPFIHRCQQSVWRYMQEWERLTERIGFWIRLDHAYVTYHQSYVESVWWSLKNLFDRGLLYQGHKIVWWWAQGGTALSSGEVGQGYREVADPSVFVRFPLVVDEKTEKLGLDANTSLLVWTTTPWTLPSNQFAAVHPELEYSVVVDEHDGQTHKLIVASALVETLAAKVKRELHVEKKLMGSKLVGCRYVPPFDYYYRSLGNVLGRVDYAPMEATVANYYFHKQGLDTADVEVEVAKSERYVGWRIVGTGFVTTDSGTGIVHIAPAFGEDDFEVLNNERRTFGSNGSGPDLLCPVASDGKFDLGPPGDRSTAEAPDYRGRWVKDCDRDISRNLRDRGLLWHQEQYLHDYPFCWRADEDPLIQYPRRSWFIRTSQFKVQMLANNAEINWLPEHIKDGRFGNFLATNVDWALSRERYWGTPLPIWVCDKTGRMEAVANYAELIAKPGVRGTEVWDAAKKKNPELVDDLKIHKPYIDAITYDSPFEKGGRMTRVTEVIDCWYDSGAMPFAQWGYPASDSAERFQENFPADFISEAIDQTRGWFYSQLAISTLVFGDVKFPHPFRNCIVLGLMLGEDGQKMSKSKRNYREPGEIFDRYGADALRWYFFANQPPWTSIRYNEQAIKDSIPEFLLRLWNVYSFLVIYANIDGFDPAKSLPGEAGQLAPEDLARAADYRPVAQRSELDRWILSELARTSAAVVERMDAYDNFNACARITEFVDALSNWYVRRSRSRFWSGESARKGSDKLDAYWTLYECLVTTAKLVAPFVPFLSETLWQGLVREPFGDRAAESVHLCDYPSANAAETDEQLSVRMNLVREIVSLGRSARMNAKLKVRQPLAKVEVILADPTHRAWLEEHNGLVKDELNVKQVEYTQKADQYISYTVLPDLKRLGPRLGKQLPALKKALAEADAAQLLARMEAEGAVTFDLPDGSVTLDAQDLQVRLQAKPGWAAAQGPAAVVVLSTELTDELVAEGHVRDLVHSIQNQRRDTDCEYTDRIELGIVTESAVLRQAIKDFAEYVQSETLCVKIVFEPLPGIGPVEIKLAGESVQIYLKRLK
ncbi:MAG TPA: isoleucine--tRNA ligase [Pirellulales bacterium]|nr:isoleucine--tRNA ligase [Pirellulales bacterium]